MAHQVEYTLLAAGVVTDPSQSFAPDIHLSKLSFLKTYICMKSIQSMLIVMFLSSSLLTYAQNDQALTREIFKELIEINPTHSTGNTTEAAEAMAARLKAAGFED
ncbi:MAG TPA: hypothetical protein PKN99_07250, partial [Cyclobacteriaceae bacterium]|nr:hypothetical protein [Cyclobacteriaceae bacterium]